ncbi:Spo0E family sporulation regulatory protein-aspartic acid phosphatase [Paenibacillus sedimenti]|nr:Spo0E family sporulation regulatory protein-aspartic acid phosphatase [Paenibacillus sedimenti]
MESVRKELHCLSKSSAYNLLHPDVLAKSAELDCYIVYFQKKMVRAEKTL